VVAVACALAGCNGKGPHTTPSPPATATPVPTGRSGPVVVTFLDATPAPGSTVTGCGTSIAGCRNRVSMRFSLRAQEAGSVLGVRVFLHATNMVACLTATTGPFTLARAETREIVVVFDQADNCGVPLTIANMALVVEGTIEVSSRQTWSLAYTFAP
jgi:hypothetical protein